ncbi:MAG: hypothetical protein Pg6C_00190 [Treponemataceae bacterium]|nr:MAG: hypothetical protein Pg6C_00190 [Treponemataceae bacterium]
MEHYRMKSFNANDYMTVVKETEDGMIVRIVRDQDGYENITTDFISRDLFESCIRTGYITKVEVRAENTSVA